MSAASFDTAFHDRLKGASRGLFWTGVAMTVLGAVALVYPVASTLVATVFVGWLLLLTGAVSLIGAFSIHGTGPFFATLLFALLSIASGMFLIFNPLAGELGLTLVLGALFMLQGASEMAFAFEIRPLRAWVGVLISSLCSIGVAILIAVTWPGASQILLGIMLGINFASTGLGFMAAARAVKQLD